MLISQIVDHALVRMQAERNLSRGKALNVALIEGLSVMGYMERKTVCDPHVYTLKTSNLGGRFYQCDKCKDVQLGVMEVKR